MSINVQYRVGMTKKWASIWMHKFFTQQSSSWKALDSFDGPEEIFIGHEKLTNLRNYHYFIFHFGSQPEEVANPKIGGIGHH